MRAMMSIALMIYIGQCLAVCPVYQFEHSVQHVLQDPTNTPQEQAKNWLIKNFGNHSKLKKSLSTVIGAEYFAIHYPLWNQKIKLHAKAAKALDCNIDQIQKCPPPGAIQLLKEETLGIQYLNLGFKLASTNTCLQNALKTAGFLEISDHQFVFISNELINPASRCPYNMAYVASEGICIDKFEAPGIAGVKPHFATKASEAIVYCKMSGKELCTESSWQKACENDQAASPFPYGTMYRPHICNDDKNWRAVNWRLVALYNPSNPEQNIPARNHVMKLNQAEPSGGRKKCKTKSEIFDLTGNVSEWVYNDRSTPSNTDGIVHKVVMKGCFWSKCYRGIKPSCSFTNPNHSQHFRSYEAGFRCCSKAYF